MALPAITSNQPSRRERWAAGVDVAAVQADDQRQVRAGQLFAVAWAGVDEAGPLVAELVLQPLRGGLHLRGAPWWRAVPGPAAGPRPAGRRTARRRPARRSGPAGRTAPGWSARAVAAASGLNVRVVRGVAGAVPPAGAVQAQRAEQGPHHDRAGVLVPARDPAVRAGDLGGHRGADLMLDQVSCTAASRSLASASCRPRVSGARAPPGQGEHLAHHRLGVVVGVHDDLHGDLHAALRPRSGLRGQGSVEATTVEPLQAQQRQQAGELVAILAETRRRCRLRRRRAAGPGSPPRGRPRPNTR